MFSIRTGNIGSASSILQNELVYKKIKEGRDPIILSYGEAPFKISNIQLDPKNWDRGMHYSESLGVPELRREITEYLKRNHNVDISWNKNLLISAGSKIISYYISQAFLNAGDKVILHEPSWVSYQEHAKLSGGEARFLPYNASIEDFEGLLAETNAKLIYINNPNNPRGKVYSRDEILWLAELTDKFGAYLAIDESYSDFVVSENFFSAANLITKYKNVIVFNSFSKNFGLSGWRLGYCVADEDIIANINKFNQHLMTCAPTCLQLALIGKLDMLRAEIKPQIENLNAKRSDVETLLDKYEFKYLSGSSTFYHFLDVSEYIKDTKEFALQFLNEDDVSVISGNAYGKSTNSFIRLSFAIESLERIEKGISLLKAKLESL
jgi:aspartate/methionine/tyrosine aminotransferase